MGLGTNHLTTSVLNQSSSKNWSPTIWSKEIQVARESNLVLSNLVDRRDEEVSEYGEKLTIVKLPNLTATAKAVNTEVTFQSTATNSVNVTIDQYYESSVMVEDSISAQSKYAVGKEYSAKCGYAIAEKIDATVATAMIAGFTQTVGTYNNALTYANIRAAKLLLDQAKAPTKDRYFVVTPKGHDDLLGLAEFTQFQLNSNKDNDNPFNSGKVGYILGMEVFMTQQDAMVTTSTQNNCFMFQKDSYVLAIQKDIKVEKGRVIEYQGDAYVTTALWGGAVVRADHGVLVKA